MTRPRKVFGRVRVQWNGSGTFIFELRKDGLRLRKLHQRKPAILLSFSHLVDLTEGQTQFKL